MENKSVKDLQDNYLEMIKELVANIKYGTVSVIIQDGKVVQIDKSEKYRIKS